MNLLRLAALAAALTVTGAAVAQEAPARERRGERPEDKEKRKVEEQRQALRRQDKIFPLDASWVAVSLNGKSFGSRERPSFVLDKQYRVRGFGGCNTFSATAYPLREQNFAVGPIAIAKRSCDKPTQEAEMRFLTSLRTSGKWDLDGNMLVLKTQTGELRFERGL